MQHVYKDLRQRIISFELEPGTSLSMRELTDEFATSQTPIREALLKLAGENLVKVVPQSGTSISLINVQQAREAHFLRLSVEIEIMRSLALSDNTDLINELEVWIRHQQVELLRSDEAVFERTDDQFHEVLFRAANVPGLIDLLSSRRGHYDRIRGLYLRHHDRRKNVITEHRALIRALKSHDPALAEKAVRQHLGKSLTIIDELRSLHPRYFATEISEWSPQRRDHQ